MREAPAREASRTRERAWVRLLVLSAPGWGKRGLAAEVCRGVGLETVERGGGTTGGQLDEGKLQRFLEETGHPSATDMLLGFNRGTINAQSSHSSFGKAPFVIGPRLERHPTLLDASGMSNPGDSRLFFSFDDPVIQYLNCGHGQHFSEGFNFRNFAPTCVRIGNSK